MSSSPPLLRGPIPQYNNPNIEPQNFEPSVFVINGITLGQTTLVTTAVNHNYVIGNLCRLLIPKGYGCTQLNESQGYVVDIPNPNQIKLTIPSLGEDPFIAANLKQKPQILAIGDINNGVTNATGRQKTGTFILGSFINISPNP